ncbi:FG-GAP-like repeat-containing protein [Streptomyces sp. NBC_01363]|uniref:FG-GAP-like repeat-containing protein n=1 Tax=Streptomyces sp. NBC_01363 TaxID=2903840 RepID=UPI0022591578|nr:FG-GAP-like repeat-containing protein [Streptomyces sp. NBC_01363]MCX4729696.1 FG-GAP-like repeat-containing protein [Streptomyces sp. NBC_01363]
MPALSHRRRLAIAAGIALVAGAVAAPAGHAATKSSAPTERSSVTAKAPSSKRLHDDFNGDGYPDVAVGAPMAVLGDPEAGAGAVSVLFGGPEGLSSAHKQVLTWPNRPDINNPEDARYGTNLRSADLDHDGYADLVSRLWAYRTDGDKGTVVAVNWGGASGLSKNATLLKPVPGDQIDGTGDLDVGDVDGDGVADIAVGDVRRGGHVLHGPISRTGQWSRASSFSVDGTAVIDTSEIAVGDVTGDGVGDLVILGFGPEDPWQQHTYLLKSSRTGFAAPVEIKDAAGAAVGGTTVGIADLDKDGHGDIVIGRDNDWAQAEPPMRKGGSLFVSYGGPKGQSTTRKPVWIDQDTEGVSGTAEFHDRMGYSLALGDTDGDGYPDIATGLPGERINGIAEAGRVLVFKGGPKGVSGAGSKEFGQYTAGVPGVAEAGDQFGEALALGDYDGKGRTEMVVGDPAENGSRGALWIFRTDATGIIAKGSVSFGAATIGAPAGPSRFSETLTG